jgi:serine/threonine-protein kinase HipA
MGQDGRFILKPASASYPEMPATEHLCMRLARQTGLTTAECGLISLSDGTLAYITRRFDRQGSVKIQLEDFCQLSGKPTARKYQGSAEALGKVIDQFSEQPLDDKLTLFQVLLFSFWTGNADMHLKNFSLWRDPRGQRIRMSPAYDLLSTRLLLSAKDDPEEMALPVSGKKHKLQWRDFLALAEAYRLPLRPVMRFREQLLDDFFAALDLVDRSFLSGERKEEFLTILRERSERLSKNRA